MTFELPKWEREAYAFDMAGKNLQQLRYTTKQLLAIAWFKNMYRRVKQLRKTLIIHIDGDHRSWKSIIACEIAWILDPTFSKGDNFEKRVIHSQTQLLDAILELDKNKIYGGAIIVDEAGKTVNKQKYYEEMAQVINENMQQFLQMEEYIAEVLEKLHITDFEVGTK